MSRPTASPRTRFASFRPVQMRWNDIDIYGHMNNAIYYELFDTAVNDWMMDVGILAPDLRGAVYLVAATSCSYFSEVVYHPKGLELGLRVTRLGSTSVTYRLGVFAHGQELSSAEGDFVHVNVDPDSRAATPIPAAHRQIFETMLLDD